MNVKRSSCDAIYMKKCATADSVLAKNRDPEKMTDEQLRKVIAPLKLEQDKAMPRTQNDFPDPLLPVGTW